MTSDNGLNHGLLPTINGYAVSDAWVGSPWPSAQQALVSLGCKRPQNWIAPVVHQCKAPIFWLGLPFTSLSVAAPVQTTVTTVKLNVEIPNGRRARNDIHDRLRATGWEITDDNSVQGTARQGNEWVVTATNAAMSGTPCIVHFRPIGDAGGLLDVTFIEPWLLVINGDTALLAFPIQQLMQLARTAKTPDTGGADLGATVQQNVVERFDFDSFPQGVVDKLSDESRVRFKNYIERIHDLDFLRQLAQEMFVLMPAADITPR